MPAPQPPLQLPVQLSAQLALQLPVLARRGFFPRVRLGWRHPGVTRVLRTLAPAVFGLALYQVNVIGARLLASFLEPGSVTYLYYAQRLMELPMGVFAVAVATAARRTRPWALKNSVVQTDSKPAASSLDSNSARS